MTAALSNPSAAALPTAAANPLASLTGRVRKLDQAEFIAVATRIAEAQAAAAGATGTTAAATPAQSVDQTAVQQQLAQAQQQQAALIAQKQQLEAQAAAAQAGSITQATPSTSTATGAAKNGAAQVSATPTTQTAPTTKTTSSAVAIPSSNVAPRTQHDYWTKHMAQFKGKYLPDGPTMRPNCGPTSVTMALRMVGLDIPGFSGQNSEAVLDKARILATGKNDYSQGTTDTELENLITKSGAKWSESANFSEMAGWVKQGIPVVLAGNPAYGWNSRYSADQVQPFNGGHWVTVSGYDSATGHFIVNDPLSQVGPIYVSEAELRSYNQPRKMADNTQSGGLGIAVFR